MGQWDKNGEVGSQEVLLKVMIDTQTGPFDII